MFVLLGGAMLNKNWQLREDADGQVPNVIVLPDAIHDDDDVDDIAAFTKVI